MNVADSMNLKAQKPAGQQASRPESPWVREFRLTVRRFSGLLAFRPAGLLAHCPAVTLSFL